MTYYSDVVGKTSGAKFVKWIASRFTGLSSAYNEYKNCRVKADTRCKHVIAADRFVGSSILYWLMIPGIVLVALPVLVTLFFVGLVESLFRTLIWIGITVKCMISTARMLLYALLIYLVGSLMWWFFACRMPITMTWFVKACSLCFDAGVFAATKYIAFLLWYVDFIVPCNIPAIPLAGAYIIFMVLGFLMAIVGLVLLLDSDFDGLEFLGFVVVVVGVGLLFGAFFLSTGVLMGSPSSTVVHSNVNVTNWACDYGDECYVRLSDGAEMCIEDDVNRITVSALLASAHNNVVVSGDRTCHVDAGAMHGDYPKFITAAGV
jgi:hypothetical protein